MSDVSDPNPDVERIDPQSLDVAEQKRQELLRLFPEVRTEGGKIDFDRLKLTLGATVDVGKERYGLTWPGKAECFRTIQTPSTATLRPMREESVNFDTTENLIIEGDNLEVLKLLQKAYLGKVKMIYIDPPYNTGNDFIYPDNYTESLQTYLQYTGQVDAEGKKFSTNTEADGRFHSKWLNMMYPRLFTARNLLADDGLIFVSSSDHEVHSLRFLMNDVFGEEGFVAQIVWKSRKYPDARAKTGVSTDHEYILVYAKSNGGILRGIERDEEKFSNPDNDPRGAWMSRSILGLATKAQRPNLHYPIVDPATGNQYEPPENTGWRYDRTRMERLIKERAILFPADPDGRPREKKFRSDLKSEFVPFPTIIDDVFTSDGTDEIRSLFGAEVFDFAKPSTLIQELLVQATDKNAIVLDFFAGSGSTAQAVIQQNHADGGARRFVLVQLPQPTGRSDFSTIAAITRERVRRFATTSGKDALVGLSDTTDVGFRALALAESNLLPWDGDTGAQSSEVEQQLALHVHHLRPERTDDDLLFEILLREGFPPTTRSDSVEVATQMAQSLAEGALMISLSRKLDLEVIRAIADRGPQRVVCLDEGFAGNDQLKANAAQIFKTKGIVFRTV